MTEIPEHLLRRSRERRAAAGGGTADEGGDAPGAAAASSTPARAAAPAAPAVAAPAAPPPPPPPVKPYVRAAQRRSKIPLWVIPVVGLLPLWAFLYAESLREPAVVLTGPVAEGEAIYARACSGCHGAGGGGGAGRPLNGGQVVLTFPGEEYFEAQVDFVTNGSSRVLGQPYGDPDRPGGAHVGGSYNGSVMPAQGLDAEGASKGPLTHEEVVAVVCYERVVIGGEEAVPQCAGDGTAAGGGGH